MNYKCCSVYKDLQKQKYPQLCFKITESEISHTTNSQRDSQIDQQTIESDYGNILQNKLQQNTENTIHKSSECTN